MNKAILIGNITQDIELKQTPSGQNVVSTSMATNENYTDKSGVKQQKADFHNIVAWGKTADLLNNYVKKWDKLYVEWRIQTRSWDHTDGIKRYKTEIIVDKIEFLTKKWEWTWQSNPNKIESDEEFKNWIQKQQQMQDEISIEDIPF